MKQTGILSNSYIPPLAPQLVAKELAKLNQDSLFNLVDLWLKMAATQPKPTKDQRAQGVTQKELLLYCTETLTRLRDQKAPKRKLIDRLLVDYYPNGLNALQLAQIDIQMMVDKPANYSWVSSTAKVVADESTVLDDFVFSLDSQLFLDRLITNLSNLYLTHIYISRHPSFPLILIRIQMYEYVHFKKSRSTDPNIADKNQPDILSRTPYYLAIPMSSPNLIHSASNEDDLVSKIILQSVEMTLSSPFRQIQLHANPDPPVRTLEAIHVLKGVSRFGQSLASWTPYADGTVDINPLGLEADHLALNPSRLAATTDKKQLVASLKFKGSTAPIKSETLFESNRQPLKTRKLNNESTESSYASLVPVQFGEFIIEDTTTGSADPTNIKLRLLGNDIFAGMHELAVTDIVDPEKVPGWLTGSENSTVGRVKNGNLS
ncbi:hypothetical protein OGAPHI_000729 [Ogataea philodendri]|uniref:Central kinetochore subunit CHL4 n=1 Tax=Ogataea philodendri TaxID=1378263 RepID=A0A9P8PEY9_9ASCO|nr:uncharacterized protein OGAPHI_000729 [Ogataea philodendri]KAH3671018.1 hypothetical protein OGAPHI_000729 [Ogataea philodendri]